MHFDVTVHLHIHDEPDVSLSAKLDRILSLLTTVTHQQEQTHMDLTALEAEVKKNTDVEASAITLIQGIAAQLAAAGTDATKLDALRVQLSDSADALAAAVAANSTPTP